jgi:glycosyltransferase involved in cell wall biosynthesis
MMKKVLIITYYWPRSGGAGVQRWLKFTKYLPEYGWEPIVLTVKEESASYAQWDETLANEINPTLRVIRTNSFEPYSLYIKFSGKKEIPYGGFTNEGNPDLFQKLSRFIRGNFFIPDPRRGWNRYAIKEAKKLMKEEKFDAIITTGPPHSTHLIGYKLKKLTGIKWIADFRDPWTDIYYYRDLSHSAPAKWYDKKLEKKVLLSSDKIATVGNTIKNLLLSKSQLLTGDKIGVITNGYDLSDFEGFDKGRAKRFTITYTGTVSPYYRLEGFVSALEELPPGIRDNVFIRFVGNISQNIAELFESAGLMSQLEYTGYVSHSQSIAYLFKSTALLLLIPDVRENKGILTGKFFEYLAAGRPIFGLGPTDGDVAGILEETGAGTMIEYDNVALLKDKIIRLFEDYKKGIVYNPSEAIEKYSRRKLAGKLIKLIEG